MTDDPAIALESLLRRAEAGERISLGTLRSEFPASWRELHDLLVVEGWLRHDAAPPEKIGGFRVLGRLGEGGTAVAWVAEVVEPRFGLAPGDVVCLKVLHPQALASPRALDRLEREAGVGARIRHRNVVHVYGYEVGHGAQEPAAFLVEEYVEGETLRERLDRRGPLPDAEVRNLVADLAEGLSAIHGAGAVHRDLKPSNVLVGADGSSRILDLGVVRVAGHSTADSRGRFVGSVSYAAPEQFEPGARTTPAADLFALGVVAYEAASGTPAFPQTRLADLREAVLACRVAPLSTVAPGVSPFLAALAGALLVRDPGRRLGPASRVAEIARVGESGAWWADRRTTG